MISNAIAYKMKENLIPSNSLMLFYDFVSGNSFTVQSGSSYQSYIRNIANTGVNGNLDGKIIDATGVSESTSLSSVTGVGGFIYGNQADFTKKSVQISGSSQIDLANSSYLMLIDSELDSDGVILGSLKKTTTNIGGTDYTYSSGFNYGQTSRGHDFINSMSNDGDYCFVKNTDEPTKRRVVGIGFNNSNSILYRFDYLNNEIESSSFSCDTSKIGKSDSLYLGSSPKYFRGVETDKLFSGKIEKVLVFSGRLSSDALFEIGKALVSDYQFTSGSVTTTGLLSGYTTQVIYKTGVTGAIVTITGYEDIQSGLPDWTISSYITGTITGKEGERIWVNYTGYIENKGYLNPSNEHFYLPTGEAAFATLGLQNSSGVFSGYAMSGGYTHQTFQRPLYGTTYLTGVTSEVSGVINVPIYQTGYITGSDQSGIFFSDSFSGFDKNLIYYLGQR